MEGLGSFDKLGFDSRQIRDNTGCVQNGSRGRVADITGIYSVSIQLGCIFVSNLSQMKKIMF